MGKKERTPAQIAATERMKAANKAKRDAAHGQPAAASTPEGVEGQARASDSGERTR